MDNLKKFVNFVEKNKESSVLDKINNLPSEFWTNEMMENYSKFEDDISNDNIDNEYDVLQHYNDDEDFEEDSFLMNNKSNDNLTEKKYSEEEEYELIDIFKEKEKENE